MVRYFFGSDTWAARQSIAALAADRAATIRWVDRGDFEERSLSEWLQGGTSSLLGKELLVLRDIAAYPKSLQEELGEVLATVRSDCVLWDRAAPDRRGALFRSLKEYATEFAVPPRSELVAWLKERARAAGGSIDDAAAAEFVTRLGEDRWLLSSELERLLLLSKRLTAEQVRSVVPDAEGEGDVFGLLNDIARGDAGAALQQVRRLLDQGHGEFYILSMLAYQCRTLFVIRVGIAQGQNAQQVAEKAKLKDFVVQKNWPVATAQSVAFWRDRLARVLALDTSIRRGAVEARTGLLMLVFAFSQA